MRFSLYMDDYETEKIFSYLRWLFLAAAALLFYLPVSSGTLRWNSESFSICIRRRIPGKTRCILNAEK